MRCPKCGGFIYRDDCRIGGAVLKVLVCMNCGWRKYEEKNLTPEEPKQREPKGTRICIVCGKEFIFYHRNQQRCKECYAKRLKRIVCPRCGREVIISEYATYCRECAKDLKSEGGKRGARIAHKARKRKEAKKYEALCVSN